MRALSFLAVFLCIGLAGTAQAKKARHHPLKSNPGGAQQRWSCQRIVESACDLAKVCQPDKSARYCKKVRARCTSQKDTGSRTATEDDVNACAQAVGQLSCKQVSFNNQDGVDFDLRKIELCQVVAKDNPVPAHPSGTDSEATEAAPKTKNQGDEADTW